MRVLLASKALVVGAHHDKLRALGANPDLDLLAVAPDRWIEQGQAQVAERPPPRGYEIVYTPLALNGRYHLFWFRRLRRLMRRFRPDVLHIDEEPYNLATAIACRDAVRYGVRPIFFAWQNLYRRYPPPFRWFERFVLARADAIVGSEAAGDVLRRKGHRRRIEMIPQFGVDPELFAPCLRARDSERFVVGYAGRLVAAKGVEVLIRAVGAIGGDVVLRLAGVGPAETDLRRMAAAMPHVAFEGAIPSADMPAFYQGLDAFVLPTVGRRGWTEQFGRAAVEAMACGVPTIVSSTGELPHVVGQAGVVTPPADAHALSDALNRLRDDPDRREHLAQAGRAHVLQRYTTQAVADATAALYRSVAGDEG
ncbi:MAG: glycosyltransferase family 4 protein [Chloroflexota bacterium]|nr:glycosyltransferase family 4 protein [Chloroflexota bacterium]MDE2919857.1 glycosyltransferase family 4 protein [Chloroflexota bacterium]